jgi:CysZ protein
VQFFKNFFLGIQAYGQAINFIRNNKMQWYIVFPAILMIAVYKLGELIQQHQVEAEADNMNELIWFLVYMLIEISIALMLMNFAKYLVVIVLSPLIAHLSAKTENILTGNTYPFDLNQFIHDVRRGLRISFRNLAWQYLIFMIVFLLSMLIFGDAKHFIAKCAIFMIGAFYYGFSYLDYVYERLKMNLHDSVLFMRQNRGLAISIGAVYSILIFMPVNLEILFSLSGFSYDGIIFQIAEFLLHIILWVAASTAPVLTIVAATIAMNNFVGLKKDAI